MDVVHWHWNDKSGGTGVDGKKRERTNIVDCQQREEAYEANTQGSSLDKERQAGRNIFSRDIKQTPDCYILENLEDRTM